VTVTLSDKWGNTVALTADLMATQLVGAHSGHIIHLTDMRPEPAPGGMGMLLHTGTTVGCHSKSSRCLCLVGDIIPTTKAEEIVPGSRLAPSLRGQAPNPSRVRANGASDAGG
jgi:hypothetical protein